MNTTGNGGGWIEEDVMDEKQFAEFERKGNVPGHFQRVKPGRLQGILERQIGQYPAGLAQAEAQATADLTAISGINEALMGVDVPGGSSGRAIELKQKQAITHIAPTFDNLRAAKKKIAELLWGKRNKPGIIPQFYTADKIYRVEGQNGQEFIHVNQQVVQQDPTAGLIVKTLNDLSQGEFDIVIADVEASTTQRQSQIWLLTDSVQKLGVPGDLVWDIILNLMDIPQKEEIKKRWQERQESQAKVAQEEMQMKIRLEEVKNQNLNQSISFKDAPPAIQLVMAVKAGLLDDETAQFAQQGIQNWIRQLFPEVAAQQTQMSEQTAPEQMPPEFLQGTQPPKISGQGQMSPEQLDRMLALAQMNQQQPQTQGGGLTQAATESLIRGMTPAM